MLRRLSTLCLVATGCWSTTPRPAAPIVANRAPAGPPRTLALPVIGEPCGDGTDGCAQDPMITSKAVARHELAGCGVATRVQLRAVMARTSTRMCHVLLARDGHPGWFVDAGLICELHGEAPRVAIEHASCHGDVLELALTTSEHDTHTVRCTAGATPACTRTPLPALEGPLADFFGRLERATERHDWKALLALAAPEHRREQIDRLGMTEPTYLAELLGMHYVDNSIGGDDGRVTVEDLDTIRGVEVTDLARTEHETYEATGWVTLTTGGRLRLTLRLRRAGERLVLFGALG